MRRTAAAFVCALLTLPGAASAQAVTAESLLAQIQELQAQIMLLKSIPAAGSTVASTGGTCIAPATQLSVSGRGAQVSLLQEFLAEEPEIYPDGLITGFYGALTKAAVERFQVKYMQLNSSVEGFGNVGPRTLAIIRKRAGCSDQNPAAGAQVQTLQSTSSGTNQSQSTNSISTAQSAPQNTTPVSLLPQNSIVPSLPQIVFVEPGSTVTANMGGGLSISWRTNNASAGGTITLELQNASTGAVVGQIVQGQSVQGAHFWNIPAPASVSGSCASNPLNCISQVAGSCTGALCTIAPGSYRIVGKFIYTGSVLSSAQSAAFTIRNPAPTTPSTPSQTSSGSNSTYTSAFDDLVASMSGGWNSNTGGTVNTGAMCTYSGVPYADGINLTVNCADMARAGVACDQQYQGMQLTCRNGQWLTPAGATTSIPGITVAPGGSCRTPWQNQYVANMSQVPFAPFFTDGVYSENATVPLMQCSNGSWLRCSTIGDNCRAYP